MADMVSPSLEAVARSPSSVQEKLNAASPGRWGMLIFGLVLIGGLIYIGTRLLSDLSGIHIVSAWPYVLLGIALLVALGFEFVNGFHDTANAVATVIYTHSLEPHLAVVWSGMWNLIGVLLSSGAVAFAVVSLLPVELILQVGKGAGFAMVFALLVSAMIWNLGTWWLGLPASSSHTLIGSIIGVGVANQLISVKTGTSGVDWGQAANVFRSLLVSPLVGFACAALLLLVAKALIKNPQLYKAPEGTEPPPFWIRCLLILTCTGVSFAHGSNDGQKGMGLIMLILIGTVPTAYALNHAVGPNQLQDFVAVSERAQTAVSHYVDPSAVVGDTRDELTTYIRTKDFTPSTMLAMRQLIGDIEHEVQLYKALASVPPQDQANVRNDMYVISESIRLWEKAGKPAISASDEATLKNYKSHLDLATKFIPSWVKVAVALALGLGTMVGWKRIVVTVGEKIGKDHLTYGQGAAAELVAAGTTLAADRFGLPVSTTHVLSSGIAGTMAANKTGLQLETVRNIALAWIFTLPAAALLAGTLFWIFSHWA